MNRTLTASKSSFSLERPGNNVAIFEFIQPGRTAVTLPEGSTWRPSPHWHERYTEHVRVQQGRVLLYLEGLSKIVTPADGVQTIPRYAIHEWMRADIESPSTDKDAGEVVVEEWTDPDDGVKEVFFRQVFSTIQDAAQFGNWTGHQIRLTSAQYDNYDVIWSGPLCWLTTHIVYAAHAAFAGVMGLRPWYEEYTPEVLRAVTARQGRKQE